MTQDDSSSLQSWMTGLLVRPRTLLNSEHELEARKHFRGSERLSPIEQLEIYREQFWLRHTASLIEDYPGLTRLLGQRAWERIVEGYLHEHPPDSPTLRDLGRHLPGYLARQTALDQLPLLVDMARLEWAYIECFDAEDGSVLEPTRLARLSDQEWAHARLVLSPALRLLELRHPVADIRRALLRGEDPSPLPAAPAQPSYLVVSRGTNHGLWDKAVPEAAWRLLLALAAGLPLVPACELVLAELPTAEAELEAQLTNWFASWGRLGWISEVISEGLGADEPQAPASHF